MTGDNGTQPRFIGVTKDQFFLVCFAGFALLTTIMVVLLAFSLNDTSRAVAASDRRASAAEAQVSAAREIINEDKVALCGIKDNAQRQVEATSNFLAHNTSSTILGLPRAQIIASLNRQRAFRDQLDGLTCP
jgi:uncharacterized membrane protein